MKSKEKKKKKNTRKEKFKQLNFSMFTEIIQPLPFYWLLKWM